MVVTISLLKILLAKFQQLLKADQQVTVIGFSLGAQVLILMLSENSNLIDKAIIISASTKPLALPRITARVATWSLPLARNKMFSRMQAKYMYLNDRYFNDYY
ncbi:MULTISPECIES: alpha/beta hydrolase [Oceanobacillus]|uniref:Alpha/beta hydrolase n=1 Tax=Oceanobacillus aidingensis TaxID=645964 RepID=A0ABV9JTS8_9BACI|nr:alpha/beta hydrolase [Oceanobacillus oncorhynchi]MDM8102235.1 alpha/beta hydrolase [Oceanobacillus oncorhynchi]